ncbi:hypothetical protein RI129_006153 [Pyrocoelia pectoralis]|uniref:Peptidase S1 domain-containing protein n=1 Tax=Pyrocoelia pectoralis TaxID=417401 RepID=A0AAN7VGH8_9COLE
MFKAVLVAVSLALVVETKSRFSALDGRIVGGVNATIEEFPYQVSLQYRHSHFCGGSIIATNRILTAAHCTNGKPNYVFNVRYGTTLPSQGGTEVDLTEIRNHPQYNPQTSDYDVCVINLSFHIVESQTAQIVNLVPVSALEGGRSAVVTGWGALQSGGPVPAQLQAVELQESNRDLCNTAYLGAITDRMICFEADGKDACGGDSGGPLVSGGVQVGIVSFGLGCAHAGYPGVYSHVANLREFIEELL